MAMAMAPKENDSIPFRSRKHEFVGAPLAWRMIVRVSDPSKRGLQRALENLLGRIFWAGLRQHLDQACVAVRNFYQAGLLLLEGRPVQGDQDDGPDDGHDGHHDDDQEGKPAAILLETRKTPSNHVLRDGLHRRSLPAFPDPGTGPASRFRVAPTPRVALRLRPARSGRWNRWGAYRKKGKGS
jgi:hypothetical protein